MSIHQQIGKRIKTARKEFGLTQKELASKLSKTPTAICYLERGQRRVTPEVLAKIAKVTKKPLSYFYGESIDENKLNEKIEFLNTHLYSVKKLLEKTDKQRVQLQNDAELFKKLFENISDMLFIADPETAELLYVNKQAYKGLGYKKEELMQKKALEIIERAIDLDTWKQMMQVLKIRKNLTTSDKLIKKDGTTLTVESNVHIVEIEGTYYIITSTRDLTEEENVIDLIESNEQRYKFLFDNARVGILLINLNGSIAAVNKELLNILKIKSIKDLSKSRENEIHMGLINQCIAKKQTISTTIKLTNRKPAMNLSICYSPIFNSKNEMTGIQGIIHEIK